MLFPFRLLTISLVALLLSVSAEPSLDLVPQPHVIEVDMTKPCELHPGVTIFYGVREAPREIERSLEPMAEVLAEELEIITGSRPKTATLGGDQIPKPGDIILRFTDPGGAFAQTEPDEDQSYRLEVSPRGVIVESDYTKGVSYGTATLVQALQLIGERPLLPTMTVEDEPDGAYRSVMLDVARKPHTIGVIKELVRMARLYKIRYIQLHLTDNESFTYPFEPVVSKLKGNPTYTKKELIELVAYADARGVTLIPEFDLPGHSAKLKASGYLDPGKTDGDVADPANYDRILAIIDDMLGVFSSSPYFHIGGDESGAGSKLVPFLERVNRHLRDDPVGGKRRMIVWEGFHGAPTKQIPAKGDDRVIVMAWESSYNAPWDLLNAGYEIINSSWKPSYLAGGGGQVYGHNTGGRKFRFEDLFRWRKSIFMHWEPGRPIYEDRGPKDLNKDDGEWDAKWIGKEDQILGAQMQFWEQSENAVMIRLPKRLAIVADRLWNPEEIPFETLKARIHKVSERVLSIVQPVKILPERPFEEAPISDIYQTYEGDSLEVSFVNRTRIPGTIRFTEGRFSNDPGRMEFSLGELPNASSESGDDSINRKGGFSLRAQLFRKDGTPVEGVSWAFFNNWPNKVRVTDYDIGRKTPAEVIDLASLPEGKIKRHFEMPFFRGPLQHIEIKGQMHLSTLTPPEGGEFELMMKSNHGKAALYIDLNRNGKWDKDERLIVTGTDEKPITSIVELEKGVGYPLRIDHMTGMPRPYIAATITHMPDGKRVPINDYLSLPPEQ